MKFKDDLIDETPTLAQALSTDSAISSILDLSIRMLPGDHGLPLQQVSVVFIICVLILQPLFLFKKKKVTQLYSRSGTCAASTPHIMWSSDSKDGV